MTTIQSVSARENYSLLINLANGNSITLNMADRLQTVRFGVLADLPFFLRAKTDGSYIRWGSQIEISLSEILQLTQK